MSPRKPTGRPTGRPKGPRRKLVLVRLEPRQEAAVRREAKRRARERGGTQPDVSAVVREIIEAWMRRSKR